MKQIAHLMVGLVFGFLLTALTFATPSSAAQDVVKTQPVRVADRESRIECRNRTIYVHILKWPEGKLLLPAIPAKIVRASVLTGGEVSLKQTDGGIELFVPFVARKEMDTIIALQLDSPANAVQLVRWSK